MNKEIKQKMFMKCTEFSPPLTPGQYRVYVDHLEEVEKYLKEQIRTSFREKEKSK